MPQRQRHRGMHPEDARLFAEAELPRLREAVTDLSHLLTRGYAEKAALKLVGDHFQLDARQRRATLGAACSEQALAARGERFVAPERLAGGGLCIDGYNLLIAVESMLAGGVLLRGRDGCIRDLASVHGSYHRVEETSDAVQLIGQTLALLRPSRVDWLFDAPVSNSGRLKQILMKEARDSGWPWNVDLRHDVDKTLAASEAVVITSDGWVLDRAKHWTRVTDLILERSGLDRTVLDLAS